MSNNSQLEEHILDSVYRYETKKTLRYYGVLFGIFLVLGLLIYGFGGATIDAIVENEINTTFMGMISGWKSIWYAIQASYEMTTFAVPLWGQLVLLGTWLVCVYIIVSVIRKRTILMKRLRSIIHYWIRGGHQEDRRT